MSRQSSSCPLSESEIRTIIELGKFQPRPLHFLANAFCRVLSLVRFVVFDFQSFVIF